MSKKRAMSLAFALSSKFLEAGNYTAAALPMDSKSRQGLLPASGSQSNDWKVPDAGFVGLSVQSVGCAWGDDFDEVVVYITKGSKRDIGLLPSDLDGVRLRLEKMGKLSVRPEAANSTTHNGNQFERKGRIACGSSCAPAGEQYAGTLGAIVRSQNGSFFLSNNHVFAACNHIPVGMPILSPSNIDTRPGGRAPGEVCRHSEIVELRSGIPNLVPTTRVDAAIAEITDLSKVSSWQGSSKVGYDTPTQVADPTPGLRVKKVGRTTGLTFGTVEAFVPTPTPLPYKSKYFNAVVWISDVWTVRAEPKKAFALGGDSGSLVVSEDGKSAIGLLFAASPSGDYGWIAPIGPVLNSFSGLSLVGNHGV